MYVGFGVSNTDAMTLGIIAGTHFKLQFRAYGGHAAKGSHLLPRLTLEGDLLFHVPRFILSVRLLPFLALQHERQT